MTDQPMADLRGNPLDDRGLPVAIVLTQNTF
jgi:hypothetical protein